MPRSPCECNSDAGENPDHWQPTDKETMKLPAAIPPEAITAIVDTREREPLDLSPLRAIRGTLATGDCSVVGLEHFVSTERKSLSDLLGCIEQERQRFDREVQLLIGYPVRALVVETTWPELEAGNWQSRVSPAAAISSVLGWIASGVSQTSAINKQGSRRISPAALPVRSIKRQNQLRIEHAVLSSAPSRRFAARMAVLKTADIPFVVGIDVSRISIGLRRCPGIEQLQRRPVPNFQLAHNKTLSKKDYDGH
jgi:hypothetical protein